MAITSEATDGSERVRVTLRFDGDDEARHLARAHRRISLAFPLPTHWRVSFDMGCVWITAPKTQRDRARAFLERIGREVLS